MVFLLLFFMLALLTNFAILIEVTGIWKARFQYWAGMLLFVFGLICEVITPNIPCSAICAVIAVFCAVVAYRAAAEIRIEKAIRALSAYDEQFPEHDEV